MGEIAEMMLDGTLCEGCGMYIDGDADGYPRRCEDCQPSSDTAQSSRKPSAPKTNCPICKRRVKLAGLADHQRDAHGIKGEA
ncbi:hypothetical protein [Cupriavidus pauculus]|jgi:Zn finger protein HypA/HybF involved in hydrogenase expression